MENGVRRVRDWKSQNKTRCVLRVAESDIIRLQDWKSRSTARSAFLPNDHFFTFA
jgi:hypothetical protein